jgi:DNA/RNA-binding domain of Phe-tRNA-synthetase-like protein
MSDISIQLTQSFHEIYPHAQVGVMILENVNNPGSCPELDRIKGQIEADLRQRFTDKAALRELPTLQAYKSYYKSFQKTYHVLSQLESVIFSSRSIPNTAALVEAMFMAELKNMLLTAGHDLDKIEMPVTIDVGSEDRQYTMMNGNLQNLKKNDMCMADRQGIISSVIYGPDQRTRLLTMTRNAMFVVYAPQGIAGEAIEQHFADIFHYTRLFSPDAKRRSVDIF